MALISATIVCRELGLSKDTLRQWVECGLVVASPLEADLGFEPDQVRRIWSILSLLQDLEVNLEGIRIILEMSEQIRDLKLALLQSGRQLASQQRVDDFRLQIFKELTGSADWEIEL
ncbi:MAG: chaperone modulator CbpM [Planctomycetota bacterium]